MQGISSFWITSCFIFFMVCMATTTAASEEPGIIPQLTVRASVSITYKVSGPVRK